MSHDRIQGPYSIGRTSKNVDDCDRIFKGLAGQYISEKDVCYTILKDKQRNRVPRFNILGQQLFNVLARAIALLQLL